MTLKRFNIKQISYALFFIVFFCFIFLLGTKYQKHKDIEDFKKQAYLIDGLVHGKCPYWGESYSQEFQIPEKYRKNARGKISVFNGQITQMSSKSWWIRTPLTSSGFSFDSRIEFPEDKEFKVGDCVRFISDAHRTYAVYHQ